MTQAEIRKLILIELSGIAPEADLSTVPPGTDLREALDLDSIDFMNVITALHERTGHPIPEADYPRLVTQDGMVAYFA